MEIDLSGYMVCIGGNCSDVGDTTWYNLDTVSAGTFLTVVAYDYTGNISDYSAEIWYEGYECLADFNGDGAVNVRDFGVFRSEFGRNDCM